MCDALEISSRHTGLELRKLNLEIIRVEVVWLCLSQEFSHLAQRALLGAQIGWPTSSGKNGLL